MYIYIDSIYTSFLNGPMALTKATHDEATGESAGGATRRDPGGEAEWDDLGCLPSCGNV